MNQERSPYRNEALGNFADSPTQSEQETELIETSQISEPAKDNYQINLLHQPVWFWQQHSCWSYFVRGLFWGGIIASTAIVSAGCGVALSKITAVEQTIAQTIIKPNSSVGQPESQATLTRPVNILLIEVQPDPDDLIKFDREFVGKSQTILLLKFDPQQGLAEVINIPTDTRVKIPGLGWGTIADAHASGGTALVSQMVNQLLNDVVIDRYVRATSQTWQQLSHSGKLTLPSCDDRIQDCGNKAEQIVRQEHAFEAISQYLSIPVYLSDFQTTVTKIEPKLDSNMSVSEIMSVVNFVQELESDQISVNLLPGYIPGKTIAKNNWRDYTHSSASPSGTLRNYASRVRRSERSPVLQPQSKINKGMQTSQKPQHLELYN
jgi:anionic cell wall polymer biosynthesis LytR-Cps2A-Psr (LCP) family protein